MSLPLNSIVETRAGKIQGLFTNGLYVFKGVPYAAPPVGDLRWLPPQPHKPWHAVRTALAFGPICPQNKSPVSTIPIPEVDEPQSEDCLYLNIWSPGLDNAQRPVMVWIHGGAFSRGSGSSPNYDGSILARRGNIVLVTLNYRLGPFGFLHLDEVTGGRIPATGNEGLLDQIAALRWVRENITFFGGDPDNITVFGESAGAMSIGCLLVMPQARGLFHKAILESGSNTFKTLDEARLLSNQLLGILGIEAADIAGLKKVSVERLLAAYQKLSLQLNIKGSILEPVVDGNVLPHFPIEGVKKGAAAGIPVIAGTNLEESRFMAAADRSLAAMDEETLIKRWQKVLPPDLVPPLVSGCRQAIKNNRSAVTTADVALAMQTDAQFRIPAFRLLEAHRANNNPAFSYIFTWRSPLAALGACHALEVGFVFGVLVPEFNGSGAKAEKLAQTMQDAWIAFARTGIPNCTSLGSWPPYGRLRETMILGEDCHVEAAPLEAERRAWEPVPDAFLG